MGSLELVRHCKIDAGRSNRAKALGSDHERSSECSEGAQGDKREQ